MKIKVKVKPGARVDLVKPSLEGDLVVYTKTPPTNNRANEAVVELLAGYFDVSKSSISILAGYRSKSKIVEVL